MNRTQRLEAAMRRAMDMLRRPKNQHSNGESAATILEVALADMSPSCCEEVRRAALEEVEAAIEQRRQEVGAQISRGKSEWPKPDYVRDDMWTAWQERRATLTNVLDDVRALSNQAPPKSQDKSGAPKSVTIPVLPVDDAAEARIEKLLEEKRAPPVCPTCGGSGYVLTKGSTWRTGSGEEAGTFGGKASCPDCAGGGK